MSWYQPQNALWIFQMEILLSLLSFLLCFLYPGSEGPMAVWGHLFLFAQPSDGSLEEKDEDSVHATILRAYKILIWDVQCRCLA